MVQDDAQSSGSRPEAGGEQQAPPKSWFSFTAWWAEQQAAGRRVSQRLRDWWRRSTAPVEELSDSTAGGASEGLKPRGLRDTARIAVWAPTAVLLALLGAGVTAAITTAALAWFQDYTISVNRLIAGVTLLAVFGLLLLWFANAPNVSTTTKRFWVLFQIEVVLLGMAALAVAIALALDQLGFLPV